jgi:hypothetical protein
MLLRVRQYFEGSHLARMSDGTYCIIRDLGLVKGGKGMRHHEVLVTFSVRIFLKRIRQRGWPSLGFFTGRIGSSEPRQIGDAGTMNITELPATES